MKILFALTFLYSMSVNCCGQVSFSTNYRTGYKLEDNKWILTGEDEVDGFYEITKGGKILLHKTSTGTEFYLIKSFNKNESKTFFNMKLIASVGVKIDLLIDSEEKKITHLMEIGVTKFKVVHNINKTW